MSQLKKEAGHLLGLVNNLEAARRRLNIPYEVIPYLAGDDSGDTMDRMVKLAHEHWQAQNDGLTVLDAPSAHVTYVMPTHEELEQRFPAYVNSEYEGVAFTPIAERANTVRSPRELPFKYVRRSRRMSDPEMVAAMLRRGLLPTLPEEELDFLKEHPEELKPGRAVWALGAHLNDGRVLFAWSHGLGRKLNLGRADYVWLEDNLFLALPQGALELSEPLPSA